MMDSYGEELTRVLREIRDQLARIGDVLIADRDASWSVPVGERDAARLQERMRNTPPPEDQS